LFVGGLTKRKGEYTLLEAAKMLKEKGFNLKLKVIIIGDGPELNGVRHYVVENKLNNIVSILKSVTDQELLLYYNSTDLFVMPSFSEPFGLVYIEALLCGLPVIGANATATPEVIPNDDYGFLVPPGDAESLAKAVQMGLNTNWNKAKMTAYSKSFAWDNNIHKFEEIYNEVLSNG
jgi:glycosyltransferase involved in cell wall biosynthesis